MNEVKPEEVVLEEDKPIKLAPVQILEKEVFITNWFLRNLWIALIFWSVFIFIMWNGIITREVLICSVFGGVVALYLSNHLKVFDLEQSNHLKEFFQIENRCFFDEEMLQSITRLSASFFRELSVVFLLEPGVQHLIRLWSDEVGLKKLIVVSLEIRWILVILGALIVLFYLVLTHLMKLVQHSILRELEGKDLATQEAFIAEFKMDVSRMGDENGEEDEES